MQVQLKSFKIKPNNDTQVQNVYAMDHVLEELLKLRNPSLDKLFGDLPQDSDVLKLTQKIYQDFNIEDCSGVSFNKHAKNPFYRFYNITYNTSAYEERCIETVLHEMAHLFCHTLFNAHYSQHNAFFTTVLKWLFKHYRLLNEDDFFIANDTATNGAVKFIDEVLVKIETISRDKAEEILSKNEFKLERKISNTEQLIYCDSDNFQHLVLFNRETGKALYTIRKLFPFEIENSIFNKMTKDEITKFIIYSPIYVMDKSGEQVTSTYYYDREDGIQINSVVEENGRLYVETNVIRNYDREQLNYELKKMVYLAKQCGDKYKRCSTINQHTSLLREMKDAVYSLNQKVN